MYALVEEDVMVIVSRLRRSSACVVMRLAGSIQYVAEAGLAVSTTTSPGCGPRAVRLNGADTSLVEVMFGGCDNTPVVAVEKDSVSTMPLGTVFDRVMCERYVSPTYMNAGSVQFSVMRPRTTTMTGELTSNEPNCPVVELTLVVAFTSRVAPTTVPTIATEAVGEFAVIVTDSGEYMMPLPLVKLMLMTSVERVGVWVRPSTSTPLYPGITACGHETTVAAYRYDVVIVNGPLRM